jgi:hypothetical protein
MQQLIEEQVAWNENIGEWQLRGIAYTGNNMMKRRSPPPPQVINNSEQDVYLVYGDADPAIRGRRPKTGKKKKSSQAKIDKLLA